MLIIQQDLIVCFSVVEIVQVGEDLELDIPRVWDNIGEVLASLITQDPRLLPLQILQPCMQPLVASGSKKEAVLIQKTLKHAAEYTVSVLKF